MDLKGKKTVSFDVLHTCVKAKRSEIKIGKNIEGRITIEFPYNPAYISKIKTIEDYRWHPEAKCSSLPSDDNALKKILRLTSKCFALLLVLTVI